MFILGISNVTRLKLSYWYHTLPQPCLISVFFLSISDKHVFPQTSKISLICSKSCWLYLKNLSRIWALPTTFTQQPGPGHSHLSYKQLFICSQCDFQSEHLKTNPDLSLLCSESSSGFSAHSEKSQSPHNGLKGPVDCSAWAHCHTSLTSSFTTFPHAHWLQPHCLLAVSGMFQASSLHGCLLCLECFSSKFLPGLCLSLVRPYQITFPYIAAVSPFPHLFFSLALIIIQHIIYFFYLVYYLLFSPRKWKIYEETELCLFWSRLFPHVWSNSWHTISTQQIFVEIHRERMNDIVLTDNFHFVSQNYSWNKKVKFFHFVALTLDNFLSFKIHFY